jgi:hypothetical protein
MAHREIQRHGRNRETDGSRNEEKEPDVMCAWQRSVHQSIALALPCRGSVALTRSHRKRRTFSVVWPR